LDGLKADFNVVKDGINGVTEVLFPFTATFSNVSEGGKPMNGI
jgi:hypothetical protein